MARPNRLPINYDSPVAEFPGKQIIGPLPFFDGSNEKAGKVCQLAVQKYRCFFMIRVMESKPLLTLCNESHSTLCVSFFKNIIAQSSGAQNEGGMPTGARNKPSYVLSSQRDKSRKVRKRLTLQADKTPRCYECEKERAERGRMLIKSLKNIPCPWNEHHFYLLATPPCFSAESWRPESNTTMPMTINRVMVPELSLFYISIVAVPPSP